MGTGAGMEAHGYGPTAAELQDKTKMASPKVHVVYKAFLRISEARFYNFKMEKAVVTTNEEQHFLKCKVNVQK